MVNAKKHAKQQKEMKNAAKEFPELDNNDLLMLRYFYSISTLSGDILDYATEKFQKEFNDLDLMNVAIFTLHGIVSAAESDDDAVKEAVKTKLGGMIDETYHLNEWIYTIAAETKAYDETFYECIKSGNLNDLDAKLDKAVKEANYKAWKDELQVIKRTTSAKDRVENITGGA